MSKLIVVREIIRPTGRVGVHRPTKLVKVIEAHGDAQALALKVLAKYQGISARRDKDYRIDLASGSKDRITTEAILYRIYKPKFGSEAKVYYGKPRPIIRYPQPA